MNFFDLQERIQTFITLRQYDNAINECEYVWNNDPKNAQLLLLMGRLYHRANKIPLAKSFFDRAAENSNGNKDILFRVEMFNRITALLPNSRTDIENSCNPDIVLIQAPGWGVKTPPLATAMLTSFIRNNGYKVLPLDFNIEFYLKRPPEFENTWKLEQSLWFWETQDSVKKLQQEFSKEVDAFVNLILATDTQIVGFTIYNSSAQISLELAHMLKKHKPDIKIIFGGPHVSRFMIGMSISENTDIDAVAQGEGEVTLINIIERIKSGRSLIDCPGLLLNVDGKVIDTGDQDLIKDLDQVPPPDFSDYTFENYLSPTCLPILSSRGCPNRCIFCNERPFWKTFRYRKAESIFEEVQLQLTRYPSVNFLEFEDSLVNGMIRELDRFAELLIESGLKLSWSGQAAIRKEMTPELLTKLKRSGCICLAYGLETSSSSLMSKVGKVLAKGADVNDIAEAHGKTNLNAVYNIMFGLPGETEEDVFDTHEFLRRNKDYSVTVNPSPSFCGFAPGTLVYEDPQKHGVDLSKGYLNWESTDGKNTYIVRLKRFEDFCRLVKEFGVPTTYPSTTLLDRNRTLGNYYAQAHNTLRARWYYTSWLKDHPDDESIKAALDNVNATDPLFLETSVKEQSCNETSVITFIPYNISDDNWIKGISKTGRAAFFIEDSIQVQTEFALFKQATFSDGTVRSIIEQKKNDNYRIIYLNGPLLDGNIVGFPQKITVQYSKEIL